MLAAAFIAFSLNQSGLTGRATGGAVGCGGIGAVTDDPFAAQPAPIDGEPVEVFELQPTLRDDGLGIDINPVRRQVPVLAGATERSTAVVTPEEFRRLRNITPGTLSEVLESRHLKLFSGLIDATGMRPIFDDPAAEFTVFAPTDEALAAWPRFEELEAREGDAFVRAFVEHHMVAGASMITDLPSEILDSMAPGQQIRIDRNSYTITSAGGSRAQVVKEGLPGERSFVHLIDNALVPVMTSVQELEIQGDHSMFLTMLDVAGELERVGRPDQGTTLLAISDPVLVGLGFVASDLRSPGMAGQVSSLVRNHLIAGLHSELVAGNEDVTTDSGLFIQSVENGSIVMSNGDEIPVQRLAEAPNGVIFDAAARIDFQP